MQNETEEPNTTEENAKPTITIAEREKETTESAASPTITIAERDDQP